MWINKTASRGDWIVVSKNSQFYIGRVLNFKKLAKGTKSECLFWGDSFDLTEGGNVNACFLLEPLFKIFRRKLSKVDQCSFHDDYFIKSCYVCHILSEKVNIPCLLQYINSNK